MQENTRHSPSLAAPVFVPLVVLAYVILGVYYLLYNDLPLPTGGFVALAASPILLYLAYEGAGSSPHLEPYGSFHLALNVLPGHKGSRPQTQWLNMGYWKVSVSRYDKCFPIILKSYVAQDTSIFPEACEGTVLRCYKIRLTLILEYLRSARSSCSRIRQH